MAAGNTRSKFWRLLPFLLILLVMLITGGIALAGVPTSLPADTKTAPPSQPKADTKTQAKPAISTNTGTGTTTKLAPPVAPNVTLYDQYNNAGTNSTVSQDFEAANDAFDNQLADDFVVPSGQTWNVNEVDVQGVY